MVLFVPVKLAICNDGMYICRFSTFLIEFLHRFRLFAEMSPCLETVHQTTTAEEYCTLEC